MKEHEMERVKADRLREAAMLSRAALVRLSEIVTDAEDHAEIEAAVTAIDSVLPREEKLCDNAN